MALADIFGGVFFWQISCYILGLLCFLMLAAFVFLGKKTHAIKELKASMKGVPLCLFFTDYKTVEWLSVRPEAGVVQTEKYGSHIVNEEGTYIDKTTRQVVIPFSADLGVGASVKSFHVSDEMSQLLKDKREMGRIREMLARGELDDARFDCLRESVDFSELKGLMNTILPHNVTALINKSVSAQLGSMGSKQGQTFFWYACLAFGVLILGGVIAYLVMGKGGSVTQVIDASSIIRGAGGAFINNASVIAG